jgi:ABC-2 type transport system permease protein
MRAAGTTMSRSRVADDLRAITIVWKRDLLRFSQDRVRAVATLLQPIMNLFVLGTGMAAMTAASGVNLRMFLFPGIIGMAVMFNALFSAGSIVTDREFGFMREMLVAPVSRSAIVIGKCLGGATTATLQGALLLCLAGFVGVPYEWRLIGTVLAESFLLAFSLSAFGVMLAARTRSMQAFMGMVQVFVMPLFFLSGAMFPLAHLPRWLSALTLVNPLTYAIDPMRRAVLASVTLPSEAARFIGGGVRWGPFALPTSVELLVVGALGAAMLAVAIAQFRRIE